MPSRGERMVRAVAGLAALAVLAGCGSTSLVNMWRDPQYSAAPVRSALVIAVRKDQVRRRIWEDTFVAALGKDGVQATPSYQIFPDQMPDTNAVREHVRQKGYDAVIVTSRAGKQELTNYVPGYVTKEPVSVYRPMWNSYVTRYRDVYHPGYTETDTAFHIQTELWAVTGEGRLVWSGTSRTISPGSSNAFSHEVAELVVEELHKAHLIP